MCGGNSTQLLKACTHILMGIICQINTPYMHLFIYDYNTGRQAFNFQANNFLLIVINGNLNHSG